MFKITPKLLRAGFAQSKIIHPRFFSVEPRSTKTLRGPVTAFSIGLMTLAAAGIWFYYDWEKENQMTKMKNNVKAHGKAALGGPWVMVDTDGVPHTDASFRGYFTLLYFGFTYCPDICPNELIKVGNIYKELGKYCRIVRRISTMNSVLLLWSWFSNFATIIDIVAIILHTEKRKVKGLKPIFISVDPARDSLKQMKHYSQDFDPNITYLTSTRDLVGDAARAFRVYFSKVW